MIWFCINPFSRIRIEDCFSFSLIWSTHSIASDSWSNSKLLEIHVKGIVNFYFSSSRQIIILSLKPFLACMLFSCSFVCQDIFVSSFWFGSKKRASCRSKLFAALRGAAMIHSLSSLLHRYRNKKRITELCCIRKLLPLLAALPCCGCRSQPPLQRRGKAFLFFFLRAFSDSTRVREVQMSIFSFAFLCL